MTDNPRTNPWRDGMSDRGRKVLLVKLRPAAIKAVLVAVKEWWRKRR